MISADIIWKEFLRINNVFYNMGDFTKISITKEARKELYAMKLDYKMDSYSEVILKCCAFYRIVADILNPSDKNASKKNNF